VLDHHLGGKEGMPGCHDFGEQSDSLPSLGMGVGQLLKSRGGKGGRTLSSLVGKETWAWGGFWG